MVCRLCNIRIANKSGSHIITDYILRSMLVEGNTSKRSDKIISYGIKSMGTEIFLGREINRDQVNTLFGRDITNDELANNINHYTIDNVFCSECENRFSFLESLFKADIYDTIKSTEPIKNRIELTNKNVHIFKLFWISIIWRCSIAQFQTFSMDSKSNEKVRLLLDTSLGGNINETIKMLVANKNRIDTEIIGVLFAKNVKDYLSNTVVCNPFLKMPYTLVINDFYIFYYSKPAHLTSIQQTMYTLESVFERDDYMNIGNCKSIKIGVIPFLKFEESKKYIYSLKAASLMKNIVRSFTDSYVKIAGLRPTDLIIAEFANDVVSNDEVSFFERYQKKRILYKIQENIMKHFPESGIMS